MLASRLRRQFRCCSSVDVEFCESDVDLCTAVKQEELQLLQRQLGEREAELRRLKEESRPRLECQSRAESGDRGEWSGISREDFED